MSSQVATAARRVNRDIRGVVVSAGLMDKTVKVRVGAQKWNKIINKVRNSRIWLVRKEVLFTDPA
jgi:small subunit ribosomal protein S17